MNTIKKYFVPLLTGIVCLPLSIYTSPAAKGQSNSSVVVPTKVINVKPVNPNTGLTPTATNTVTIYLADSKCQNLVPEQISVASAPTIEAVVGKILERRNNGDFSIVGYRVSIESTTRIATVDMRLPPNSRRQFVSLSQCEQFALFGSLHKTLTTNKTWNIRDVRFTEQGQVLYI